MYLKSTLVLGFSKMASIITDGWIENVQIYALHFSSCSVSFCVPFFSWCSVNKANCSIQIQISNYEWRVAIVLSQMNNYASELVSILETCHSCYVFFSFLMFFLWCLWLLAFARYIHDFIVRHCIAYDMTRKKSISNSFHSYYDTCKRTHIHMIIWADHSFRLFFRNGMKPSSLELQRYCCSCAICR